MDLKITLISTLIFYQVCALDDPRNARILDYRFENIGVGRYEFAFETSDGIKREEQGTLSNPGTENEAVIVRGSYSYTDLDGKTYTVRYTADENGFHPEGDHIKVPPFVPWIKHGNDGHNHGSEIHEDEIDNRREYLPSTPSPLGPQVPNPRPPSRPQYIPQQSINNLIPGNTNNAYIPTTPRAVTFGGAVNKIGGDFNSLDPQLQSTLVNLLAKEGRGLDISSINSLQ